MSISIIFSFRNEEKVLPELIDRVLKVLKKTGVEYELIFVNDDSSDGSLELLKRAREQNENIKIINMSRRFGVGPCIMAGLRYAKGEAAIYMDADLQDPPEVIPALLEKWKEGADVVHTVRTARKEESIFKTWLTKAAYKIINLISDIEIPEDAGDFKLLSRRAIDEIIRLDECDPYLRGLACWIGFKQTKVFYERAPRFAGRSHCPLFRSAGPAKMFICGVTFISELPLYMALALSLFVFALAAIYITWAVMARSQGMILTELSAVVVAMLLLGSAILFTIGILGIYIGRIYRETRNRPSYIIESKIGV